MTEDLRRILAEHSSVAVVGLSTDPAKAAHAIPAFLKSTRWRVVPVHPRVVEIQCVGRLSAMYAIRHDGEPT